MELRAAMIQGSGRSVAMFPRWGVVLLGFILGVWPVKGQYALGTRAGVLSMEMLSRGAAKAVQPITTGSFGLFMQVPLGDRSGYRLALDHVARRCALARYTRHDRMEELAMRTTFVQLTTEVRFRLGDRSPIHFEFGPQLGFQLTERSTGTSYYTYSINGADPRVVDESHSPMRFSDVRLRTGLGADFTLGQHLVVVVSAGAASGSGDWFRQTSYFSVEFHGHAGVAYTPWPLVRKRRA